MWLDNDYFFFFFFFLKPLTRLFVILVRMTKRKKNKIKENKTVTWV